MNRHAGPPTRDDSPPAPEPTFAERARTLVQRVRSGTLATQSRRHVGFPFASVMPYALDAAGRPVVLISTMAVHTQNLDADPKASLLVAQPSVDVDPLALGRVTLMGEARRVVPAEIDGARSGYLERHPAAAAWVDFGDFGFWRLEVASLYFVGGFGAMGWVDAAEYRSAEPDPLAAVSDGVMEHMNRDHADALVTYARVFAEAPADAATMTAVDRLGFTLRLQHGQRRSSVRIAFPREVRSADECRVVLIEMLRQARG